MTSSRIAFIGGGNMASAIISGLLRQGHAAADLLVIDPSPEQAARLRQTWGVTTLPAADASLASASLVVWAVKPQQFASAAAPCRAHTAGALHLSVMAGLRLADIARALGTPAVVRTMPNTPALIGQGVIGVFAPVSVSAADKGRVEDLLRPMGAVLWVAQESDLDAVTALSGSGPAYVFYFLEAMQEAAVRMGLSAEQGRELALGTFAGASALARQSSDGFATLREKVTSKGGTTAAALAVLDDRQVKAAFIAALDAARERARTLGDEFGRSAG